MNDSRLKDIKLIVLDIDGTLLSDDGVIGSETKDLVGRLQKKGVQFSFATGRLHSAVTAFAKELRIDVPLITLDGCLIKAYGSTEVIHESIVKRKHVITALQYAEMYLINICLCHDDAIYYTENNSIIPQITEKFGAKFQLVDSYEDYTGRTLEVVMAGDNRPALNYVLDKLSFPYCSGLNKSFFRSHSYENIYYLEVRKSGSSKGKGLQRLMKHLKVAAQNTAVVGDWYNDISLFQPKTINVAVANAVEELKKKAHIVTQRSNNEDAVAEFLNMVIKHKS